VANELILIVEDNPQESEARARNVPVKDYRMIEAGAAP
jgi:hypothetical protein